MREIVHIQAGLIAAAAIVTTMMGPQDSGTDAAPDAGTTVVVAQADGD